MNERTRCFRVPITNWWSINCCCCCIDVLPNLASSERAVIAGSWAIGSIVGIVKCSDNTTEEICSAKHIVFGMLSLCDADCAVITQKSIYDSEKCTWDAATATCS